MKRTLIASMLVLALAACGSKKSSPPEAKPTEVAGAPAAGGAGILKPTEVARPTEAVRPTDTTTAAKATETAEPTTADKVTEAAKPDEESAKPVEAAAKPLDKAVFQKVAGSKLKLPAGDCHGEGTLGQKFSSFRKEMSGPASAGCEGKLCEVQISTPLDPDCNPEEEDGCDGSGFSVTFEIDAAGAIIPSSLFCVASG